MLTCNMLTLQQERVETKILLLENQLRGSVKVGNPDFDPSGVDLFTTSTRLPLLLALLFVPYGE
jgi:hypothetical protein